nr:hypothetical protein [Deinococcus radiodurans]
MKIKRGTPRHELREAKVRVAMYGDFGAAHSEGDNTDLVATDTVRNTVYGLAKEGFESSIEEFGKELLTHFVKVGPRVTGGSPSSPSISGNGSRPPRSPRAMTTPSSGRCPNAPPASKPRMVGVLR